MILVMMLSFYYFSRHVSACLPTLPPLRTIWSQDPGTQAPQECWLPLPSLACGHGRAIVPSIFRFPSLSYKENSSLRLPPDGLQHADTAHGGDIEA